MLEQTNSSKLIRNRKEYRKEKKSGGGGGRLQSSIRKELYHIKHVISMQVIVQLFSIKKR